jgi:PiT family inorganic phosphate transporter
MIELLVYGIGIALSFLIAWGLGANDAANPTECAVGAGVISMKKATLLFSLFAALGGILLGPFVMKTVDRGIVPRELLSLEMVTVGSFTAVAAAGIWIIFSTWRGMPISTTHSIIGGIFGFGLIATPTLINWGTFGIVILSLIVSPILSILLAGGLFLLLRFHLRKTGGKGSPKVIYLLIFILSFATSISIFTKILNWGIIEALAGGIIASLVLSSISLLVFQKMYGKFEKTQSLSYLLIIALCFSAFSFGANDMANATGVFVTPTEKLAGTPTLDTMVLLSIVGAIGITVGGLTWGYKVITTSAFQVTRLDPLTGAAAEYSNAATVFIFTTIPAFLIGFGMPISTTHASIGSLIGVGLANRGLTGIDMKTTSKIFAFWILTIPAVALISMTLFSLISQVMVIK